MLNCSHNLNQESGISYELAYTGIYKISCMLCLISSVGECPVAYNIVSKLCWGEGCEVDVKCVFFSLAPEYYLPNYWCAL